MSAQDDLKARFLKFREKKYAVPIGLVLALLLGSLMTPFLGAVCFGSLLIAIVGFYIPYYFGLKDRRKLAVWGLVFVLGISVPFTYYAAVGSVNSLEGLELESTDGVLMNGTIAPYRGSSGDSYTFGVTVTDSTIANYSVRVIISDLYTFQEVGNYSMASAGSVAGGERYAFSTAVEGESLFSYRFATNANGTWVSSFESYGPVHQSDLDIFIHFLPMYFFALLVQVGLLFYLLLAFSWFSDRSKKQMEEVMKQREKMQKAPSGKPDTMDKFVCSECGADVPADSSKCPQCGESFEDEPEARPSSVKKAQFECSECGADVDEGARTCWNCGKEFED